MTEQTLQQKIEYCESFVVETDLEESLWEINREQQELLKKCKEALNRLYCGTITYNGRTYDSLLDELISELKKAGA